MLENKIIILGSDHNGVELKQKICKMLCDNDIIFIDLGPNDPNISVDYVFYAKQVSKIVSSNKNFLGVLICGTGQGMSIVANKTPKIRASLVHNIYSAKKSKEHNDANVLCLGAWVNGDNLNLEMTQIWLQEKFGEYRHVKRIEQIDSPSIEKIIFTNGVFDIVHTGHIELLKFAKFLGGKLIVGLNSDNSVKILKGKGRPINNEVDRKLVLDSLKFVDEVIIFDFEKPIDLIKLIKPNVVIKGGEWTAEQVRVRDQIPEEIDIKIFPLIPKYSTTNILNDIKKI